MDNNNGQWQQPPQGMPPQNGQWQQPPQGMPQQNGPWQRPPQGMPPQNGYYNNGMYGMRPPKKNNTGLIVLIIIIVLALAAGGVCAFGYFKLGWFSSEGKAIQEFSTDVLPESDWGRDRIKENYSSNPDDFKVEIESGDGKTADRIVFSGVGDVSKDFYINIGANLKNPESDYLNSPLGWFVLIDDLTARINIPLEYRGCEGKMFVKDMLKELFNLCFLRLLSRTQR